MRKVETWFSKQIGAFVDISKSIVLTVHDFIFFGNESGITLNENIGDSSRPISIYAKNASSPWNFWEYKIGVSIKIGKFSLSNEFGLAEAGMSIGYGNHSIDFTAGINKIAIGTSTSDGNGSYYNQVYVRAIPAILLGIATFFTGGLILAPAFG